MPESFSVGAEKKNINKILISKNVIYTKFNRRYIKFLFKLATPTGMHLNQSRFIKIKNQLIQELS